MTKAKFLAAFRRRSRWAQKLVDADTRKDLDALLAPGNKLLLEASRALLEEARRYYDDDDKPQPNALWLERLALRIQRELKRRGA